jgi:hypothetical protein
MFHSYENNLFRFFILIFRIFEFLDNLKGKQISLDDNFKRQEVYGSHSHLKIFTSITMFYFATVNFIIDNIINEYC